MIMTNPYNLYRRPYGMWIYLPIMLLLSSCYEEFTPNIDTKPVLCLNSLITAGEPIHVDVTHTWLYTDLEGAKDHAVNDAIVKIYANGELIDSNYIPSEGDKIMITADSESYGHAEAEVTVPHATSIKEVRFTPHLISSWSNESDHWFINSSYDFNVDIQLDIDDPGDAENYYRFSYLSFNQGELDYNSGITTPDTSKEYFNGIQDIDAGYGELDQPGGFYSTNFYAGRLDYRSEPIFTEHIGMFETILSGDYSGFEFFTDRQFQGSVYHLNLQFANCYYKIVLQNPDTDIVNCGYYLTLHTISKSYYDWANYKWQEEDGPITDLGTSGLADPMWAYSNVSTGAGVVAACSTVTYELNIRDYILSLISSTQQTNE